MHVPGSGDGRGQSETLGVALLLGIAVIGAVIVAATGLSALDSDQDRVGTEQAERSLSQFDAEASAVALGRSESARVDFGLPDGQGSMSTRPDEGWMRVEYTDLTGFRDPNNATVANVSLGSVVFAQDDRTVGYQGGGVFRSNGNGSALVSRPEFHYRNGTVTVPIIAIDGESSLASRAQVTPNRTIRKFPAPSQNLTNKIDNSTVIVTVKSRYYRAWAEFFRGYTSGIVTSNDTDQTASVQFVSLPDREGIEGGIIATAESGHLALKGTGAYVDSYNSSEGPYSSSAASDGTVKAVGNVTVSADATIDGTAQTGQWLGVENTDAEVSGDGLYTTGLTNDGTIGGTTTQIDGVPTVLPIDTLVISRLNEIRVSNNNSAANARAGVSNLKGGLDVTAGQQVTLEAGRYFTQSVSVDGGTLVLDTSDGNITMAVEDWMAVTKSGSDAGNLTIKGDGIVKVYLTNRAENAVSITGRGNTDVNFFVGKDSTVHIPGDISSRFRVFASQDIRAAIAGDSGKNATFHGLIYAPDGLRQNGWVYTKQANVYGGLVSGEITLGQYGQIHYDKGLEDLLLPRASRISRLEFMHVSINRINVTSG
jgi:hypothetical protein